MSFVCLECGIDFDSRPELGAHWEAERHGPSSVQRDALDRAKFGMTGRGLDDDGNDRDDDEDDD